MKKKDRFVCWVPCKPYVKQYLLYNFNAPDETWPEIIDLSADRDLHADFIERLDKKEARYEKRYSNLYRYPEKVAIEIKKDEFYRYGWCISNESAVRFGNKIEHRIKQMLFLYLDTYVSMGIQLSIAIRNFQAKFGYNEDNWPYDSIRREYNRHGYRKNNGLPIIFEHFNKRIMDKLSQFGTITPQGKEAYENI